MKKENAAISPQPTQPSARATPAFDSREFLTRYLAKVIREAMEDFHQENLSDRQMKALNPIIRDAIYTALYAYENSATSLAAQHFFAMNAQMLPDYWEPPRLLEEFVALEKHWDQAAPADTEKRPRRRGKGR